MCCVTVQVCHILFLALRIPDGDIPGRHSRLSGTVRMAFMICTNQQIVGHISRELATDAAASADTHALVFNFVISTIFDITEAQCTGIQPVFICRCRGRNHRTVQLRMLSGGDIKPAPAGKNPCLLLHTVVVTVHFIPAEAHTRRTAHGPESEAASGAGILLLTVITVTVLLTGQCQMTTGIHFHRFTASLRAGKRGVPPADNGQPISRIHRGFCMGGTVAFFTALTLVCAG
ncbi:hypothetical protein BvCmsKSNP073_05813 [Escherichia coli]|nr:hypothetical protein BvCmsKSNP073_05813 [Escherichia coli]